MNVAGVLCSYASSVQWESLPDDVKRLARMAVIDHIACAVGGVGAEWVEGARRIFEGWGGRPEATVIGSEMRLPTVWASFLNAHAANALDFDDTYRDLGHPGTTTIPAALSVAEAVGATGAETVAAIVAGYEVGLRVARGTRPDDAWFRRVFPTVWHGLSAAIAAGKLLGLNDEGLLATIGIACEIAPLSTFLTPETTYAFKAGKFGAYAAAGVQAAYLASEGLHGKQRPLDSDTPFWQAFGSNRASGEAMTHDLGADYLMRDLSFKPYPACRFTHSALDAIGDLRARGGWRAVPHRIRGLRVETFTRALQLREPVPESAVHAPFCFPYLVAVAATGIPTAQWFAPETLSSTDVLDLARKVELVADPEFDSLIDTAGDQPARVVLESDDGARDVSTVLGPSGDASTSEQEGLVIEKFEAMLGTWMSARSLEALRGILLGFDAYHVGDITPQLRFSANSSAKGGAL